MSIEAGSGIGSMGSGKSGGGIATMSRSSSFGSNRENGIGGSAKPSLSFRGVSEHTHAPSPRISFSGKEGGSQIPSSSRGMPHPTDFQQSSDRHIPGAERHALFGTKPIWQAPRVESSKTFQKNNAHPISFKLPPSEAKSMFDTRPLQEKNKAFATQKNVVAHKIKTPSDSEYHTTPREKVGILSPQLSEPSASVPRQALAFESRQPESENHTRERGRTSISQSRPQSKEQRRDDGSPQQKKSRMNENISAPHRKPIDVLTKKTEIQTPHDKTPVFRTGRVGENNIPRLSWEANQLQKHVVAQRSRLQSSDTSEKRVARQILKIERQLKTLQSDKSMINPDSKALAFKAASNMHIDVGLIHTAELSSTHQSSLAQAEPSSGKVEQQTAVQRAVAQNLEQGAKVVRLMTDLGLSRQNAEKRVAAILSETQFKNVNVEQTTQQESGINQTREEATNQNVSINQTTGNRLPLTPQRDTETDENRKKLATNAAATLLKVNRGTVDASMVAGIMANYQNNPEIKSQIVKASQKPDGSYTEVVMAVAGGGQISSPEQAIGITSKAVINNPAVKMPNENTNDSVTDADVQKVLSQKPIQNSFMNIVKNLVSSF